MWHQTPRSIEKQDKRRGNVSWKLTEIAYICALHFTEFPVEVIANIFYTSKLRFKEISNLTDPAPAESEPAPGSSDAKSSSLSLLLLSFCLDPATPAVEEDWDSIQGVNCSSSQSPAAELTEAEMKCRSAGTPRTGRRRAGAQHRAVSVLYPRGKEGS